MRMTNTLEKSGTPLGARQTSRPLALPHVYVTGQTPHELPLPPAPALLADTLVDALLDVEAPPTPPLLALTLLVELALVLLVPVVWLAPPVPVVWLAPPLPAL